MKVGWGNRDNISWGNKNSPSLFASCSSARRRSLATSVTRRDLRAAVAMAERVGASHAHHAVLRLGLLGDGRPSRPRARIVRSSRHSVVCHSLKRQLEWRNVSHIQRSKTCTWRAIYITGDAEGTYTSYCNHNCVTKYRIYIGINKTKVAVITNLQIQTKGSILSWRI